jgi:hypothetical protein
VLSHLKSAFSLLQFINVEENPVPSNDPPLIVSQRHATTQMPAILTIRSTVTRLILKRPWQRTPSNDSSVAEDHRGELPPSLKLGLLLLALCSFLFWRISRSLERTITAAEMCPGRNSAVATKANYAETRHQGAMIAGPVRQEVSVDSSNF